MRLALLLRPGSGLPDVVESALDHGVRVDDLAVWVHVVVVAAVLPVQLVRFRRLEQRVEDASFGLDGTLVCCALTNPVDAGLACGHVLAVLGLDLGDFACRRVLGEAECADPRVLDVEETDALARSKTEEV